jgi:hypothetical protein
VALRGGPELRRRLKAIKTVFKPIGRNWAEDTVRLASSRVRTKTGKTKRSIRVKNASMKKAAVEAKHGARFLEAGAAPHQLTPRKFTAMKFTPKSGGIRFTKKARHPGMRAQPFLHDSARDALARNPMAEELIRLWNQAA